MRIKCTKCTFSKSLYFTAFRGDIKKSLRGVDKEKLIVHNKNVLNSVVETLNSIYNIRNIKMKVHGINNNYTNINNNQKQYASRPVFKQSQSAGIAQRAIVDQFIEAAADKKNSQNPLVSKLSFLKDVLFSAETTRRAKELQDVIDGFDSSHNILFKI